MSFEKNITETSLQIPESNMLQGVVKNREEKMNNEYHKNETLNIRDFLELYNGAYIAAILSKTHRKKLEGFFNLQSTKMILGALKNGEDRFSLVPKNERADITANGLLAIEEVTEEIRNIFLDAFSKTFDQEQKVEHSFSEDNNKHSKILVDIQTITKNELVTVLQKIKESSKDSIFHTNTKDAVTIMILQFLKDIRRERLGDTEKMRQNQKYIQEYRAENPLNALAKDPIPNTETERNIYVHLLSKYLTLVSDENGGVKIQEGVVTNSKKCFPTEIWKHLPEFQISLLNDLRNRMGRIWEKEKSENTFEYDIRDFLHQFPPHKFHNLPNDTGGQYDCWQFDDDQLRIMQHYAQMLSERESENIQTYKEWANYKPIPQNKKIYNEMCGFFEGMFGIEKKPDWEMVYIKNLSFYVRESFAIFKKKFTEKSADTHQNEEEQEIRETLLQHIEAIECGGRFSWHRPLHSFANEEELAPLFPEIKEALSTFYGNIEKAEEDIIRIVTALEKEQKKEHNKQHPITKIQHLKRSAIAVVVAGILYGAYNIYDHYHSDEYWTKIQRAENIRACKNSAQKAHDEMYSKYAYGWSYPLYWFKRGIRNGTRLSLEFLIGADVTPFDFWHSDETAYLDQAKKCDTDSHPENIKFPETIFYKYYPEEVLKECRYNFYVAQKEAKKKMGISLLSYFNGEHSRKKKANQNLLRKWQKQYCHLSLKQPKDDSSKGYNFLNSSTFPTEIVVSNFIKEGQY